MAAGTASILPDCEQLCETARRHVKRVQEVAFYKNNMHVPTNNNALINFG